MLAKLRIRNTAVNKAKEIDFDDLENIVPHQSIDYSSDSDCIESPSLFSVNIESSFKRNHSKENVIIHNGKTANSNNKILSTMANFTTRHQLLSNREKSINLTTDTENVHPNTIHTMKRTVSFNKLFQSTVFAEHKLTTRPVSQSLKTPTSIAHCASTDDDRFTSSRSQIFMQSKHHSSSISTDIGADKRHNKDGRNDGSGDEVHVRDRVDYDTEYLFSKVRHNHYDYVAQLLLQKGSALDWNAVDNNGNTILHICAQNNNKRIAALILNDKYVGTQCNINAVNHKFYTPLDYAEKYGFVKVASFLTVRGAISGMQSEHHHREYNGNATGQFSGRY